MTTNSAAIPYPGDVEVNPNSLGIAKARLFAFAIQRLSFVRLVSCRKDTARPDTEIVVIEVQVERPQSPAHDIRHREVLAVEFTQSDLVFPLVLSMRKDFPVVPHLNGSEADAPRSLCLYEAPYAEIKLRWTPHNFLETIRAWLARTADGTLHQATQPIEPLLLVGLWHAILPGSLVSLVNGQSALVVIRQVPSKHHITFSIHDVPLPAESFQPNALVVKLIGTPHLHGVIERLPATLPDLHALLAPIGIDVLGSVRDAIRKSVNDQTFLQKRTTKLVLLVDFAKIRHEGGAVENVERWAFLSIDNIENIAVDVGIMDRGGGSVGYLLVPDLSRNGERVAILPCKPYLRLTRDSAATFNGVRPSTHSFMMIGLGALGSQIYLNCLRCGFGEWTLIDADIVLPHNLARHALVNCVGVPKVEATADFGKLILEDVETRAIEADILTFPTVQDPEIASALPNLAAILDCSASFAVSRHLASDFPSDVRRISIFLNSTGTDLVVLCEPSSRDTRLDDLEMQYYRFVFHDDRLQHHFTSPSPGIRYSVSCSDISAVIPHDLVSVFAAVASRKIRRLSESSEAFIGVWTVSPATMEVSLAIEVVSSVNTQSLGGWEIRYDDAVIKIMRDFRQSKLPTETGGILIGDFDTQRKIVYLVDALSAPADSIEKVSCFIRGTSGLSSALDMVSKRTGQQLKYVGEWHSHPRKTAPIASADDERLLEILSQVVAEDGLPEIMCIIGDNSIGMYLKDHVKR
jgi:integrative and conjugative element protein (TIGR02256 family)